MTAARPAAAEVSAAELLRHAVLAPSSHNTQPWLFRWERGTLGLYADRTRALPVNDPEDRELTISCGAALLNLRVAAHHLGLPHAVELMPRCDDPDLLAVLRFGDAGEARRDGELGALFPALPRRRTYRRAFAEREVPTELVERLAAAAAEEGAELVIVPHAKKQPLAELVAEGDRTQWADRRWRRELAAWMHPRRSGDGLTVPWVASAVQPLVVRTFDLGRGQAAKDAELAEGSPLMAVLTTDRDSPRDWLDAGQALERALLEAAGAGVQSSYLNQPVQAAEVRPALRELLDRPAFPQVVLRLGYEDEPLDPSPRRPVEDVLEVS